MYRVFILIFFVTPTLNNKDNNYIKVMYYIKIKNTSMDHNRLYSYINQHPIKVLTNRLSIYQSMIDNNIPFGKSKATQGGETMGGI